MLTLGEADSSLPFCLIRIERVMAATDFGRTKIAELIDPASPRYDPTFPKPRRAGAEILPIRKSAAP